MSPQPKSEVALSAGVERISGDTFSRLLRINDWPARAGQAQYNVKTLAKNCGISVRHLERFFHEYFGKSPKQWMRLVRMNRAVELLRQHFSSKEIAAQLGFHDAAHFSKRFSSTFGLPPAQFHKLLAAPKPVEAELSGTPESPE